MDEWPTLDALGKLPIADRKGPTSLHDMALKEIYDEIYPDMGALISDPRSPAWEHIRQLPDGRFGVRFFRVPAGEENPKGDEGVPVG